MKDLSEEVKVNFDGGFKGNSRRTKARYLLCDCKGGFVLVGSFFLGEQTNNFVKG